MNYVYVLRCTDLEEMECMKLREINEAILASGEVFATKKAAMSACKTYLWEDEANGQIDCGCGKSNSKLVWETNKKKTEWWLQYDCHSVQFMVYKMKVQS